MTFEEANKIYKGWQAYMEIVDKLSTIFNQLPESFLPYPAEVLEEALNIIAQKYIDDGDKKMYDTVQGTMWGFLPNHIADAEAMESMNRALELMMKHPELKNTYLENLRKTRNNWLKISIKRNELSEDNFQLS